MNTRALTMNVLKSLILLAFATVGCDGGKFIAEELKPEVVEVTAKLCEESFIRVYADVASQVNGKNYALEISKDKKALERLVKVCDALMVTAPYGACKFEVGEKASFVIEDRTFESTCLQASEDLNKVKNPEPVVVAPTPVVEDQEMKYCSANFVLLYEGVEKLVSDKDYAREIKGNARALKNIVKACDALMLLAPNGNCKIRQSQSGTVISDFDFESICLDAVEDFRKVSAQKPPLTTMTPQGGASSADILKTSVNFELKVTNPEAMATLINSQKLRDYYILFFVGGTRLTHSPTSDLIGIGCSVYTDVLLTGVDLGKPLRLERKTIKPIAAGVIVLFEMNANQKKFNIQCFKKVSERNSRFTLSDISKHLGTYFQIVLKQNTI